MRWRRRRAPCTHSARKRTRPAPFHHRVLRVRAACGEGLTPSGARDGSVRNVRAQGRLEQLECAGIVARAHNGDLHGVGHSPVERSEQAAKRCREAGHEAGLSVEDSMGDVPMAFVSEKVRAPNQKLDGERISGWGGVVHEVPRPDGQHLAVVGAVVEDAVRVVPKELDDALRNPRGLVQPPRLERRLIHAEDCVAHPGVVLQESIDPCRAVLVRSPEPVTLPHAPEQKIEPAHGCFTKARLIQRTTRLGQRSDRHPVPAGEDLLVAERRLSEFSGL